MVCPTKAALPSPALLDRGFASGAEAYVPLLLPREGLGVLSKALAALRGSALRGLTIVLSVGTLQTSSSQRCPPRASAKPPVILWTCWCPHRAALTHTGPPGSFYPGCSSLCLAFLSDLIHPSSSSTQASLLSLRSTAPGMWRSFFHAAQVEDRVQQRTSATGDRWRPWCQAASPRRWAAGLAIVP